MENLPWEVLLSTALTTLTALVVTALYRKFETYINDSLSWRNCMNEWRESSMRAQQTTMRATLIHNAEKYLSRGWITMEERTSWVDMHAQYSALGANGLIDTYRVKIDALPDRSIDDIVGSGL